MATASGAASAVPQDEKPIYIRCPIGCFRESRCYYCLNLRPVPSIPGLTCTRCNFVSYCCVNCHRRDWVMVHVLECYIMRRPMFQANYNPCWTTLQDLQQLVLRLFCYLKLRTTIDQIRPDPILLEKVSREGIPDSFADLVCTYLPEAVMSDFQPNESQHPLFKHLGMLGGIVRHGRTNIMNKDDRTQRLGWAYKLYRKTSTLQPLDLDMWGT